MKIMGQHENARGFQDKYEIGGKTKYHYSVLYTKVLKQWEVTQAIRKALPEGRGTVFYPCVELWWNGSDDTVIRPLFPGYVFIRSDMEPAKLHDMVRRHRDEVFSFIRELRVAEKKAAGEVLFEEGDRETAMYDLSDDEAEFLDFMLNFEYEYAEMKTDAAKTDGCKDKNAKNGEKKSTGQCAGKQKKLQKIPDAGVLRMSYGYREGKKYVVMEGPLRGYEDHIVDVNARDRKAYLDIKINGQIVRAGLELRGKKYWFPDDRHASAILEDGTEIDPAEIARLMMG